MAVRNQVRETGCTYSKKILSTRLFNSPERKDYWLENTKDVITKIKLLYMI